MAGGRPTKYDPIYCDMVIKHMEDGNSFWSFAGVINVAMDTLHNWTKNHEEFSEAKKIGLAKLLLFDERIARAGTTGQLQRHAKTVRTVTTSKEGVTTENEEKFYDAATFAQTYHIFMMKNRYPKLYRDKIQIDTSGGSDPNKKSQALQEIMKDPALAEAARIIAEKMADE